MKTDGPVFVVRVDQQKNETDQRNITKGGRHVFVHTQPGGGSRGYRARTRSRARAYRRAALLAKAAIRLRAAISTKRHVRLSPMTLYPKSRSYATLLCNQSRWPLIG